MSRHVLKILGAFLVLVLIAAACGSDSDENTEATQEPVEEPEAPATEAPSDDGDSDDGDTDSGDTDDGDTDSGDSGDGDDGSEPVDIGYDEPRGELFTSFQSTFDRSHPFQPLDTFCTATPDPDEAPQATDLSITEDSIVLVHLRTRLEELEGIGFAVPVGDPLDMFEAFVDVINEECNGIWGRKIDLRLVEVSALGGGGESIDTLRNQACIEATEDEEAVIVLNSTGFQGSAILCIADDHDTLFLTTQGNPNQFYEQANGRLYSLSPTADNSVKSMVEAVIDSGALEGKTIGVVWPDTPGQPETVQNGILNVLEAAGYEVAVAEQIGCSGSTTCRDGNDIAVENLLEEGVDVLFPTLNVVSLPGFIVEMANQGFAPGDIQFYNSDFNAQAGDLVSGKIPEFGGAISGEIYNGTVIVDDAPTGYFRLTDEDPVLGFVAPFNVMCNEVYAANSPRGLSHELVEGDDSAFGMVTTVCAELRMAARAIYDAGPNPTREDIYDAFADLGSVDIQHQLPGSFGPDKFGAPDVVAELKFQYPCPRNPDINSCIEQTKPYRAAFEN